MTFFLNKRFADKWMDNASLTYANPTVNFDRAAERTRFAVVSCHG